MAISEKMRLLLIVRDKVCKIKYECIFVQGYTVFSRVRRRRRRRREKSDDEEEEEERPPP